jgi:hypothetical protein
VDIARNAFQVSFRGRDVSAGSKRQRAELLDEVCAALRVVDRALDLAAMTDDARVLEQTVDVAAGEARDAGHVEAGERAAEVLALAEDRQPAQAALESLQTDLLEERGIVADRDAPFRVVVFDVTSIAAAPAAPYATVRSAP